MLHGVVAIQPRMIQGFAGCQALAGFEDHQRANERDALGGDVFPLGPTGGVLGPLDVLVSCSAVRTTREAECKDT